MSKSLIVVDVDDVLADTTEALRHFVNTQYGYSLEKSHYQIEGKYWGYYETVWSQHDINGDGILDRFHSESSKGEIAIKPIEGSVDGIVKLAQQFNLAAVSSRTSIQQEQTALWLRAVYGDVFSEVHCIDSRHTGATKGDVCRELGASYLVDDNIEHCKTALESGVIPILFGVYGWQDKGAAAAFLRCENWVEVAEYFDGRG